MQAAIRTRRVHSEVPDLPLLTVAETPGGVMTMLIERTTTIPTNDDQLVGGGSVRPGCDFATSELQHEPTVAISLDAMCPCGAAVHAVSLGRGLLKYRILVGPGRHYTVSGVSDRWWRAAQGQPNTSSLHRFPGLEGTTGSIGLGQLELLFPISRPVGVEQTTCASGCRGAHGLTKPA